MALQLSHRTHPLQGLRHAPVTPVRARWAHEPMEAGAAYEIVLVVDAHREAHRLSEMPRSPRTSAGTEAGVLRCLVTEWV